MNQTHAEANKTLVLDAFDALFNKRDYAAAERFWSPTYIQHSAHISPGREGLFELIRSAPETLRYEHGVILADGDFVMVHGRFSETAVPWRGSRSISFGSKTDCWRSTGMFCRTRHPNCLR